MTIGQQLLEKRFLEIDHDRLTIRARVGADTVKYHLYEKWVIDEVNRQVGAWQHDGKVFSAAVFGERFAAALKKIGARGDDFALTVVVCQGWPHMPQVSITPEDPGHSQLRLRIADDRAKLAEFRADWLVAKVRHDLDALGIDQEVNPAQLTAALLRARTGDFPAGGERLHLVQKRSKSLMHQSMNA